MVLRIRRRGRRGTDARCFRQPILLLLSLISLAAQAQGIVDSPDPSASAGEHFAAGSEAFNRGDYAVALTEFQAAVAAGSPGPSARYNAAVCHYQLGDYSAAETAFRNLAFDFPEMRPLADYNLGLSLVRLNRIDEARAAFRRATSPDDEEIATLAHAMLARLPEAQAASSEEPWFGLVDLNLGQDDNAALIDPLGLPAGQSTDSPFGELSLYVDGPLAASDYWRLSASAFFLDYVDADSFDQSGLNLGVAHSRRVGRWIVSAGPHFGRTYIDGDGFEEYLGVAARFGHTLSAMRASIELEIRHDETDGIEAQFAYISGQRDQFRARFNKRIGRSLLLFDYRMRRDDRSGDSVSADSRRYGLTLGRALAPRWRGELMLEYRDTEYDRSSPVRTEARSQARVSGIRELASDWRFTAEYWYTDNDSSDNVFNYRRNRFSIGAGKSF